MGFSSKSINHDLLYKQLLIELWSRDIYGTLKGDRLNKDFGITLLNVEVPIGLKYEPHPYFSNHYDKLPISHIITDVTIMPSRGNKHRVYVRCPSCKKVIPAGRLQQHYKVHSDESTTN